MHPADMESAHLMHQEEWMVPDPSRHATPGAAIAVAGVLLLCSVIVGMVLGLLGYGLWRLTS